MDRGKGVAQLMSFLHALSWIGERAVSVAVSGFGFGGGHCPVYDGELVFYVVYLFKHAVNSQASWTLKNRGHGGSWGYNGWKQAADEAGQQS